MAWWIINCTVIAVKQVVIVMGWLFMSWWFPCTKKRDVVKTHQGMFTTIVLPKIAKEINLLSRIVLHGTLFMICNTLIHLIHWRIIYQVLSWFFSALDKTRDWLLFVKVTLFSYMSWIEMWAWTTFIRQSLHRFPRSSCIENNVFKIDIFSSYFRRKTFKTTKWTKEMDKKSSQLGVWE